MQGQLLQSKIFRTSSEYIKLINLFVEGKNVKINLFLAKESNRCFNKRADLFGRYFSKPKNPLFPFSQHPYPAQSLPSLDSLFSFPRSLWSLISVQAIPRAFLFYNQFYLHKLILNIKMTSWNMRMPFYWDSGQ